MSQKSTDLNDKEIDDLTREIEGLSLQLESLRERLAKATTRKRNESSSVGNKPNRVKRNRPLSIGDRVRVTNNYKCRKGLTGVITRTTNAQAYVKPDNGEAIFRSYKANLKRIQP
jgi:hypothetical protein